jgi:hypothetical protein
MPASFRREGRDTLILGRLTGQKNFLPTAAIKPVYAPIRIPSFGLLLLFQQHNPSDQIVNFNRFPPHPKSGKGNLPPMHLSLNALPHNPIHMVSSDCIRTHRSPAAVQKR